MAMILLVTGVVVALVPPRRSSAPASIPPPSVSSAPERSIHLRFPPPAHAPVTRLAQDAHVVIIVSASEPGEANVMGLTDTAEPGTPATFDVLTPSPAIYSATFTPAFGKPQRIGTIDVAR